MAVNIASVVRTNNLNDYICLDSDKTSKFLARCVTPGEPIICEDDCMRGHGMVKQLAEGETELSSRAAYAAVAGRIEQINKLVSVAPIRSAYVPAVGDVVVGRVVEVAAHAHRWMVDIRATRNAALPLASVNLPGNEVRRRGREDASMMRSILREGDLLIAEVHSVHEDGQPFLHTRSERYGPLTNAGRLVRVPVSLVKRTKAHFHTLPAGGVQMLIGTNGLVWLSAASSQLDLLIGPEHSTAFGGVSASSQRAEAYGPYATEGDTFGSAMYVDAAERLALSAEGRETVARAALCIEALARGGVALCDTSVLSALECSARIGDGSVRQFAVHPHRTDELIRLVRERLAFELAAADRMDAV